MNKNIKIFEDLDKIASLIPVPLYWLNTEGIYIGMNKLYLEVTGVISSKDLIGKKYDEFHPKDIEGKVKKNLKLVLSAGETVKTEEVVKDFKTGKEKWFIAIKSPLYDENNTIAGIIAILVEITDRKGKEEKIKIVAAEKMMTFSRLMEESMAHELRTPFGAIGSQIDALKIDFKLCATKEEVEKEFQSIYKKIKMAIQEGIDSINGMLIKLRNL